ncbi:MAG: OB-fold domain-containing protein [Mycobacterium sp.]
MRQTDPRPVPAPDDVSGFYWDAAAEHRLVLQRCRSCRKLQYPPEICCVHCQSDDFELAEVTGRGVLYSYAAVDRALHAGFVKTLPYVVAFVELDEQPGLRILANLVDVPAGTELSCGMPVEVTFEDRGAVTLPQFRPAVTS